jgi:hypothetical protein
MALPGPLAQELHRILLDAFGQAELEQLVHFHLDIRLAVIAGGSNLSEVAYNLILATERLGRTEDLIAAVARSRPENLAVQRFLNLYCAAETAYLRTLLADVEARAGVGEYVDLSGEYAEPVPPSRSTLYDEWGFAELAQPPPAASFSVRSGLSGLIARHQRFVLLGRPGGGKTTTLRWLARNVARQRLADRESAPLPLLLSLPQWSSEQSLQDFLGAHWPGLADLMGELSKGRVLLLLDGLNEMGSRGVQRALVLKAWLAGLDPRARVIVTCRSVDYPHLDLKVPTVTIDDLEEGQIRAYIQAYLGARADEFLHKTLQTSREELQPMMRVLSLNPYFLRALIYLFEYTPASDIPTNVGTLFGKLVRALWKREESRFSTAGLAFSQVESALAALAYAMVCERMPVEAPCGYVEEKGLDKTMVELAVRASYLDAAGDSVRFYHETLQEYFAAVHIAQDLSPANLEFTLSQFCALQSSPHGAGRIDTSIIRSTREQNVLKCVAGIAPDPQRFLEMLLARHPYLAAEAIMSGVTTDLPMLRRIWRRLCQEHENWFSAAWSYSTASSDAMDSDEYLGRWSQVERHLYYYKDVLTRLRAWAVSSGFSPDDFHLPSNHHRQP